MSEYYINYESGSDSNAGTAIAPWKHLPYDERADGNSASAVLASGDTLYIENSSSYTYASKIYISTDGVTVDGSSWGAGTRAIVTDNVTDGGTAFDYAFVVAQTDGVTVKGFHFYKCGGPPMSVYEEPVDGWNEVRDTLESEVYTAGGVNFNRCDGGLVEDCYFEEIGQWRNAKPFSGTTGLSGTGIGAFTVTNFTIKDCDFYQMGFPIAIKHVASSDVNDGINITGCNIHGILNWGINIATTPLGTNKNITIQNTSFVDYNQADYWDGFGIDGPHRDGIFLRNSESNTIWENIVVQRCVFRCDTQTTGGTGSIYVSYGPSIDVLNCLFLNDPAGTAVVAIGWPKITASDQIVRICGNTFVGGSRPLSVTPTNSSPDSVLFRNNVIYRKVGAEFTTLANLNPSNLDSDYNLWFCDDPDIESKIIIIDPDHRTFAQWQALGQDTHSVLVDPELTATSGDASTWDVTPVAGSNVSFAGTAIPTIYARDYNGSIYDSPFDIGAIALNTVDGVPEDPTGLTVTAI